MLWRVLILRNHIICYFLVIDISIDLLMWLMAVIDMDFAKNTSAALLQGDDGCRWSRQLRRCCGNAAVVNETPTRKKKKNSCSSSSALRISHEYFWCAWRLQKKKGRWKITVRRHSDFSNAHRAGVSKESKRNATCKKNPKEKNSGRRRSRCTRHENNGLLFLGIRDGNYWHRIGMPNPNHALSCQTMTEPHCTKRK